MQSSSRLALAGLGAAGALLTLNLVAKARAEARHPPRGDFIDAGGVRLHYVEVGAGTPIVLLHGNGSAHGDFFGSGLVEALARRHRVIVFDRPGYGYSERPRLGTWSPQGQARLLARAFDRLGLDRPVVVGHSWGALLTACLALDHPSRVGASVLMGGYYFPKPRMDVVLFSGPSVPVLGDAARFTLSPLLARLIWPHLLARIFAPQPVPERFQAAVPREMAVRPGCLRAAAEESASMIPSAARLESRYAGMVPPAVLVAGVQDAMVDTESQTVRLYRTIRGARLHLVPGAGHMVHWADPDRVADAVEEAVTLRRAAR